MTSPCRHATVQRSTGTLALCLAFAVSILAIAPATAAAQTATNYEVKAAFLLNFAKFVEWPAGGSDALVIGVLGHDSLADTLKELAQGRQIQGRALSVVRVTAKDDLSRLQMLFVGVSEAAKVAAIIKRIGTAAVLTVSDADRFCELGGVVQFRNEDDRVRFDINLDVAEAGGLAINSKLLALARAVHSTKTR